MNDNGTTQQDIQQYIADQSEPIPPTLIAQIKTDTVLEQTGKPWAEWFIILDDVFARRDGQATAASFISQVHDVNEWWAQTIVTRYEIVLGLHS